MDAPQLAQFEALCTALMSPHSSPQFRAQAHQQLEQLHTSAENISQFQYALDHSTQPHAQLVASQSLIILVTQFWNNFSSEQKLELRHYILNFLGQRGVGMDGDVLRFLSKLFCRITKLGWFDSTEHREIVGEITNFLKATVSHILVGLGILRGIVDEMNTPIAGRTLTVHRKTAVSFRDHALFPIFEIAITTLRQLQSSTMAGLGVVEKTRMSNYALSLATDCLSFDFIGTNPEESSEDVSTVQVPSSWKPIVQDTTTIQLFFDFYASSDPPQSSIALQALVQISSVRRSLFPSEAERNAFLQGLMTGIQGIMVSKRGLDNPDNYHEFCRLLGRLKASYQLSELVKIVGFSEWLELCRDFTERSLKAWQGNMNSIHYLLALWGRLVAALPYLRPEVSDAQRQSQSLRQCVLQVVESYMTTMLESVEVVVASGDRIEDPLEDESSLKEQMERLPVIARLQYDVVAQFLIGECGKNLATYQLVAAHSAAAMDLKAVEGRMTWLVYMIAAITGVQAASDPRKNGAEEMMWDGRLCRCVFDIVEMVDRRLVSSSPQRPATGENLELAILNFFRSFKKSFVVEAGASSMGLGGSGMSSLSMQPVTSGSAHPLLSLALAYSSGAGRGDDEKDASAGGGTIYDVMALGDSTQVMNIVVNKMCNNIKFWNDEDKILGETLEVFTDLVSSYSSSKTLLGLETVRFLVQNHDGEHFPFLGFDNDNKYRVTFYTSLSRLVFSSSEDVDNLFDTFIGPNMAILNQLGGLPDLRSREIRMACIGALRDLRGVTVSAYNKRTYGLLFDALYPAAFTLFVKIAQTWFDDPIVMTALLKFMQEFVFNKAQRIFFEQSSANGILLFRKTSEIVCAYGSQILSVPVRDNVYKEKYKGIRLLLNTLTCALTGNYVNFGVFSLYEDPALQNALDVSLQLCLQIPLADVLTYPKLSKAYFAFLDVLFRNHLDVLSGLDSSVFLQLVKTNHEGLQSNDLTVSALCASVVDHLATYMFLNQTKDKPTVRAIQAHVASEPDVLNQLMNTLMNTLLYTSHANHWAVTRPILSLLLASQESFGVYQAQLIGSQAPENQEKLKEEFGKLVQDVQPSVETTNRDKFTQKLTMFRLNVRQFLTL